MRDLGSIGAATRVCAVIGNPLGHTLSPAIHNAAYAALDLDFVYVAFPVERAADAVAALRALKNFQGLSVTIPHKIEVMKHVDEVPELDRLIGSINTVVKEPSGKVVGFGTDGPAAVKALHDARVEIDGKRVLFLGAGGAARAIAFALAWQAKPASIVLTDLDAGVARGLADDVARGTDTPTSAAAASPEAIETALRTADIVVHCTPVGMHPKTEASLVPPRLLREGQVVFDIVYNPLKTRLIQDAEAQGLTAIPGVEMFVNQAVLQFERFTGAGAPVDVMRKAVMEPLTS